MSDRVSLRGPVVRVAAALATSALCAGTLHAQGSTHKKQSRPVTRESAIGDSTPSVALHTIAARSIGPAVMGGRVSTIALDTKTPTTFYAGLGMGNLMKTTDNGTTFAAVFDHEKIGSIGDVEVAPSDSRSTVGGQW